MMYFSILLIIDFGPFNAFFWMNSQEWDTIETVVAVNACGIGPTVRPINQQLMVYGLRSTTVLNMLWPLIVLSVIG